MLSALPSSSSKTEYNGHITPLCERGSTMYGKVIERLACKLTPKDRLSTGLLLTSAESSERTCVSVTTTQQEDVMKMKENKGHKKATALTEKASPVDHEAARLHNVACWGPFCIQIFTP